MVVGMLKKIGFLEFYIALLEKSTIEAVQNHRKVEDVSPKQIVSCSNWANFMYL